MKNVLSATIVMFIDGSDAGASLRLLVHRRIRQQRTTPPEGLLLFRHTEPARA